MLFAHVGNAHTPRALRIAPHMCFSQTTRGDNGLGSLCAEPTSCYHLAVLRASF